MLKSATTHELSLLSTGQGEWSESGIRAAEIDAITIEGTETAPQQHHETLAKFSEQLRVLDAKGALDEKGKKALLAVNELVTRYGEIAVGIKKRVAAINEVAVTGLLLTSQSIDVRAGPNYAYTANAQRFLSMDLGLGIFPLLEGSYVAPYVGANVYFRSVNREAPITEFGQCFSLLIGATLTSIEQEDRRKGLFADSGLVLGAGVRLNRYLRVSAGAVIYQAINPNPLLDSTSINASPFVCNRSGAGLHWDLTAGPHT